MDSTFILILFICTIYILCMQITSTNTNTILRILLQSMDKLPKNSFPKDSNGSIQESFGTIPQPTIYNAHGIVTPNNPNTLLARV